MKRLLCSILIICLITSLGITSSATENTLNSGACGKNVFWHLDDNGVLTISGKGDMENYSITEDWQSNADICKDVPWRSSYNDISYVVIKQGVTSIGNAAFAYIGLQNIEIADSVTKIGEEAFMGCDRLTHIKIPDGVTEIGAWTFAYNNNLISVDMSNDLNFIGAAAFNSCFNLKNIHLPDGLKSIDDNAFSGCESLININIPDSVGIIGYCAFSGCKSLADITLPNKLDTIDSHVFDYCTSLKSIVIPRKVRIIENGFWGCNNLSDIYYEGSKSDWDRIYIEKFELVDGSYQNIFNDTINIHFNSSRKKEISVVLNGQKIEFDQPPVMINNRVMVPIRAVAEKMGDTVKWSNYLNSALIVHADRMVIFKNNSEQSLIYADPTDSSTWSSYYCDVPPQVINDRTLTPVRAIGECLGAKVDWDGETQTVIINYDKNTPHTLKDNAFTQLNAYYSSLLQASDFTTYSDEINEFYNSRSNWADAFIIFWDDWTISLDILASGEKANVYMLKNCFAEILSEIPDSDLKDFDVYTEILDWLSKTSKLADIDFTKVDKVVNISVQTANSLSKFGNAIDRAGTALDFTGVGIDVLAELLSDYSTGMLYIDTLRNSFKNSGIEDEVIYTALDELENDYVNKCANILIENATSMSSSALLKLITSGAFNVASFGKNILNWVVDNDDKADAVKNINCKYLFNEYIDKAYSDVRNNLIAEPTEIDVYIRLFNFQKIAKTKMYESMGRLRKKSDQYTQTRINEQLDKLRKSSYIIWE